ncbi:helix-turn-helix domain-containing protein [Chitinophaga sp. GCM10012297]|uniref:Helix-turn-helix transcriptional regulator n=1 Tax=Chitinophaga chungangae TaxID=2821488 RepID=A0ABS3Y9F0_9BACT|nr:helix-turn-helix transcriptional regulator [Chitinophaga chungangae]MBO9150759.1 helix-turn-helix transcriptional regulator [Chitinophaga chungangae]
MARRKSIKEIDTEFEAFKTKVGERMKELRLERGYNSYEQFAFDNDIGRAQYGKYERGSEDLRLSSLYKILKAMDISFTDFFKRIN